MFEGDRKAREKNSKEIIEDCEQKVRPILLQTVMKGMADSCFSY